MATYALGILIVLALLAGWVAVQAAYRRFSRRHPECGPWRGEGPHCGACAASDSCAAEERRKV
ncbi:MAG: hypothetical protein OHK0026_05420 [Rhodocyclaceae bacterium]